MMTLSSIGTWLLTYLVHSSLIVGAVYLWSRRSRAGAATVPM